MFQNFRNFQNIRVGATLGQGVPVPPPGYVFKTITVGGVIYNLTRVVGGIVYLQLESA